MTKNMTDRLLLCSGACRPNHACQQVHTYLTSQLEILTCQWEVQLYDPCTVASFKSSNLFFYQLKQISDDLVGQESGQVQYSERSWDQVFTICPLLFSLLPRRFVILVDLIFSRCPSNSHTQCDFLTEFTYCLVQHLCTLKCNILCFRMSYTLQDWTCSTCYL